MINAAKADGQIDQGEMQRIVGKLEDAGMSAEDQRYVLTEMKNPMNTQTLIAAANGRPTLAAQIYAASLLAIEVDTPAEKSYLDQLAGGYGSRRRGDRADQAHGRFAGLTAKRPLQPSWDAAKAAMAPTAARAYMPGPVQPE